MHSARFDSKKTNLVDLLRDVDSGKLHLPDFQRGWVWDDEHIRSLLGSISVSFPIGAIMTLTPEGDASFPPRLIEGVTSLNTDPERLLLDGQQRLTSLYQALYSQAAVNTRDARGKVIRLRYYIDMRKALDENADRDEWIKSVPEGGIVHTRNIELDVSRPELEHKEHLFPANQVFRPTRWLAGYVKDGGDIDLVEEFNENVIERFQGYALPVIELGKETPMEAICLVFEKVNTGGVTLTVFELITAKFAAREFSLRKDWDERKERMTRARELLKGVTSDQFLQVVTLLTTLERRRERSAAGVPQDSLPAVSARRRDILRLTLDEYKKYARDVERGFIRAADFLIRQCVYTARDIPYQTQMVPLAAILTDMGSKSLPAKARKKLARWYWCGVFGEMYAGSVETIFARDLTEVPAWIGNAEAEPRTIADSNFQANRLLTLRNRNSAAYKGVYALLVQLGSADFRTGDRLDLARFFELAIDIHHIFPQSWCKKQKKPRIPKETYDSIINKTALSAHTNRHVIRGDAPSEYLERLEDEIDRDDLDSALQTHAVPIDEIRADDFWGFFAKRAEDLLKLIGEATGKTITRDPQAFLSGAPIEEYEDPEEDS